MIHDPADPSLPEDDDQPASPARRRLLGGATLAAAALALGSRNSDAANPAATTTKHSTGAVDDQLRRHIQHVVVLFAENRSFNNLFAAFPGLQQPLARVPVEAMRQRDRDGSLLTTLPPIWGGMVPHAQTVEHRKFHIDESAISGLANQPFALRTPDGDPLPQGVITRNLVHKFYENQLQINGGRNDHFVAWGDSGAFTMGYYADGGVNLRLWQLASQFTLCDNFFMGAFGGSFLNHQYMACAQPPRYPHADKTVARFQIVQLEDNDPAGIRPRLAEDSPRSAMQGRPKFASPDALTPDFWVVNTMGPAYAPAFTTDPRDVLLADPGSPNTLPPQMHMTIGDALSAANVDWAWYAGGWQLALDGKGEGTPDAFPEVPNFQVHHQPFNYFRQFAPGTAARKQHLRDGGYGETARTNKFLAAVEAGTLPPVTFYKPQGNLNMHAGYADVDSGDRHLTRVVDALRSSPQWPQMLVVVTVDENGGWWDHVAPPKGDRWGPGTRIPALVISPFARKGFVDHTIYDTGSILRFITRRFGLKKLPGLRMREQAMLAAGGPEPGDLTAALQLD